ncbi:MAG: Gfo/Idh/MocA family protein [Sphaerochaetaceae bacterium]
MRQMRFGLIGYGKVANLHAQALRETTHAVLVSVCGHDPVKCGAFAAKWSIPARSSVADMVALDGIEAVIITTPHPRHYADALEALAAGCHVLVEKPMALTEAECDGMIQASILAGKTLSTISQRRWYPSCQRIRAAIDSGKLGMAAIAQVVILGWRDQAYYSSDPWRGKWDTEGGGVLINQAVHQIDLMCWYMGAVAEVQAYWDNINHPYIEVEDTVVASLRFKNGGLGSVLVSNSQKPGIYAKVYIHGSNGASAGVQTDGGPMFLPGQSGAMDPPVNDLWTIAGEEHLLSPWREQDEAFFKTVDAKTYFFALQIEDFVEAISQGRSPLVSREDGRETVRVIEGIYRSGREGRPVSFC